MAVSAFTFKLQGAATQKGLTSFVDTVVVMANTAAIALALLESHYPEAPKAAWDLVATPSAEAAATDWKGWRTTVSIKVVTPTVGVAGSTHVFKYTGIAGDTSTLVATALTALMVADPTFPGTISSGAVITLAAADNVGDSVITVKEEFIGNNAVENDVFNPRSEDNLQNITAFDPAIQSVQAAGATRTVTVHAITDLPRIVGFFQDRSAL